MATLSQQRLTFGAAIALTLGLSATSFAQVVVGPGYPYPPAYPAYRYARADASVRFDVKPKDTAVYVDGYYAGVVDDYDGAFQRLRTAPGGHEITLFLDGYRTYSEHVYLSPDNTFKFKHRMEKLGAGDVAERPPAPQPPAQYQAGQPGQPGPGQDGQVGAPLPRPPYGPYGRRGPQPPYYPPAPEGAAVPPAPGVPGQPGATAGRGTLALSLQPGDAEVMVDGTPWQGPGGDRVSIDLAEGHHSLQIRKAGFIGYLTDIQIQRGQTTTLEVQLKPQPQ